MPQIVKQKPIPKSLTQTLPSSAWDFCDGIKMLLYGRSGTGKTTLWSTFRGKILALICSGGSRPGELRSINTPEMRKKIDAKIVNETSQIKDMLADADDYSTIVLDHGSGLQDLTLKEILGVDELPAQKGWGMATQQQYGQSTLQCKEIFRSLLGLPQNVVIVAQERDFNAESENELIAPTIGAALTPSLTGWLNPAVDYVCQTYLRPKTELQKIIVGGKTTEKPKRVKGIEYCLRTEPHDVYHSKFRLVKGRELPECIVDPSYDKIVALIEGK